MQHLFHEDVMRGSTRYRWAWLSPLLVVCACAPQVPDDLPGLLEAMGSNDMRVHFAASEKVKNTFGEQGLIAALRYNNAGTRARAAMWLHHFRTPEARAALVTASGDRDDHVRMWVAYSLGEIGTSADMATLERLAGDPAAIVGLKAAEAIQKLKAREGIEAQKG
jgi:HEAT repeat protein